MRIVLIILFLIIASGVIVGFSIRNDDHATGEFLIGASIATLFFIWMPLFIYHRWKDRSFKDYMLTKENIDKMKDEGSKKNL